MNYREREYMKISVVIPAFNREKYIVKCLDSIVNQSYKPYEIVVIDDASTDNTVALVEEYSNTIIKIIKCKKNGGAQKARNIGIKEATGEWIAFMDSDDEWLPDKLEKQKKMIEILGYNVCAGGAFVCKKDSNKKWLCDGKSGYVYEEVLKLRTYLLFQTLLIKKECIINAGGLDEKVVAYQELDTAIRIAKLEKIAYLDEPLFKYYLHEDDTISKNRINGINGRKYIFDKYRTEIIKYGGNEAMSAWCRGFAADYGIKSLKFIKYVFMWFIYKLK